MLQKIVEVYKEFGETGYKLRHRFINPTHIVSMHEDEPMLRNLKEGYLPKDLEPNARFVRISLDRGHTGLDIIVVGMLEPLAKNLS